MSENFDIEVISPERKLLTEKVISVVIPAYEGDMTILSNHIPLITFLRPGIVKINSKKEIQYFVEEGTVEFSNNKLVILSSTIIELSSLSKDKISKMLEECKVQLNKENIDDKKRYVVSHKVECLSRVNQ